MMTKKQLKALHDVAANLRYSTNGKGYGEAKTSRGYLVADGVVGIVYPESVPELAENSTLSPTDSIHDMIEDGLTKGTYRLVDYPFSGEIQVSKIRKQIAEYAVEDKAIRRKTIDLTAHLENGSVIVGRYNVKHLMNAIDAVGSDPMMYIGTLNRRPPTIIVCNKDHICDFDNGIHAIVMPLRIT